MKNRIFLTLLMLLSVVNIPHILADSSEDDKQLTRVNASEQTLKSALAESAETQDSPSDTKTSDTDKLDYLQSNISEIDQKHIDALLQDAYRELALLDQISEQLARLITQNQVKILNKDLVVKNIMHNRAIISSLLNAEFEIKTHAIL